jgi:phosphotriesterase-related protein
LDRIFLFNSFTAIKNRGKMSVLYTTLGVMKAHQVGMILPHEHIFVDLRTPETPGYGQAEPEDVVRLMKPELDKVREAGVSLIVECSPEGVGRRVDLVAHVSKAANFPLVVPTGIYREPWVPEWAKQATIEELRDWMKKELEDEVGETGVRAGFIKLSAGDQGITPLEEKILRAAARAARSVNAVIASHTIKAAVVNHQLNIIEEEGYNLERFIWVHASAEGDVNLNLAVARRGAWIEYDWIGREGKDDDFIFRIKKFLENDLASKLLLSHDYGWYDPAKPGGGTPKPFTYISKVFLPKLTQSGIPAPTIDLLVKENPFQAFSR